MRLDFREISTSAGLERAYPLLRELRTELAFTDFIDLYEKARRADEFRLVGAFDGDVCVGLMGYRVLHDFVHGRHLYIDDLVTTGSRRSTGVGARLLNHAEKEARRLDCQGLRLCTGIANESARRFYEREGWEAKSVAFKKKITAQKSES